MRLETVEKPITIGSGNIDLGEALRAYAEAEMLKVASKYFGRLTQGSAHFGREGEFYRCSVSFQMGGLPRMAAEATAAEARLAFDQALEKVAKQLRRKKRELREDKNA